MIKKILPTLTSQKYWKGLGKNIISIVFFFAAIGVTKFAINYFSERITINRAQQLEGTSRTTFEKNINNLPNNEVQQLADLREKALQAILNNLEGQDRDDFIRIATKQKTPDEVEMFVKLILKAEKTMSPDDRRLVEQLGEAGTQLIK